MANTTINFTIRALDGTVVPLTQFQIESGRLNTGEIPDVMPATTSFMTDANGQATVSLTVTEAPYYISKLDGTTDKVISYKFFVPESISPISGEMLYVDLGKNSKFYNDKSVAALIEAKIVAVNARNQVQLYIASNIATKLAIDAVALQVQNEHVAIQVLHDSTQAIVNTAVTTINTNTAAQVANVKVITDPWLGTKSVAPTVRNDSTPLQNGDEYFDTVAMGRMAYFNGTWYVSGVSNVTNTLFSGNGITTGFVLPVDPHGINNTVVYIDSVYQQKSTYSVSGTNITFSTAPITGTNNIDVTVAAAVVIGTLPASGVTFTPSGTLSSTNVQSAITELVTDLAASSGSSMVGYMPAGTGAVSRTVQSKLRESVSVMDFGAVGDGVTDDTVAIQAAIDYVQNTYSPGAYGSNSPAAGPSELFFPAGFYKITAALVVTKKIAIKGDGQSEYSSGSRILQTNPNIDLFQINPISSGMSFSVEDIVLRHNGAGSGILINTNKTSAYCNSQRYVGCTFGPPASVAVKIIGNDIEFLNCLFDVSVGACAIQLGTNTVGEIASDVRIVGCNFFQQAVRCILAYQINGIVITGCVSYSDGTVYTLRFFDGIDSLPLLIKNVTITGNTLRHVRTVFGAADAVNVVISGNIFTDLGIGAGEVKDAIDLVGSTNGFSLTGNLFAGTFDTHQFYSDANGPVINACISNNVFKNMGGVGYALQISNTTGTIGQNTFDGFISNSVSQSFTFTSLDPSGQVIGVGAYYTETVFVKGVIPGDIVSLGARGALALGIIREAWVSALNTVTIKYTNLSSIITGQPSNDIRILVTR